MYKRQAGYGAGGLTGWATGYGIGGAACTGGGITCLLYTSSGGDEAKIRAVLESLCRPNVLRVLFALSSLTSEDFLNAVTLEELAVACRLSEDRAASALDNIPLEYVENTVEPYFRLASSYRHMPVLLSLLSMN